MKSVKLNFNGKSITTITSIGKKLGLHTCFQIDKY
jgi:hypothetical protein